MNGYQILLFYKYVHIPNPIEVRDWQEELCKKHNLKGRLIIAPEGLNITLEGTIEDTEQYIQALDANPLFHNIHFKKSVGTGHAFRKLSVRVREEIVSGHLGVCDIDPNQVTGKRLKADELHAWIRAGRECYIIDMRNVYEHQVGKFKDSICPPLEHFRDLPRIIKTISHLKDKTVVTVCTGGVRCEKASGYLITQGFNDVWQLDGGIVTYMEQYPNEDFEGKLYVFDNRISMGFYTNDEKHTVIGACKACEKSCERFVNCEHVWCGRHFILCGECDNTSKKEKGLVSCPDKCLYRRPYKIGSPMKRIFIRMKTLFR
jgi:UPF0176 protein